MKKILAWVLCAIMLISAVPAVLAEDEFTITVSSTSCDPGDTGVTLTVSIANNPGFFAMQLERVFADELTFKSSTSTTSDLKKTGTAKQPNILIESQVVDEETEEDMDYTANGNILTLKFDVADTVAPGDYAVTFNVLSANNYARQYLHNDMVVVAGNIHVNGEIDTSLEVGDYKGTRAQVDWLVPTETGKVFAGWYADDAFTTVYTETTGKAYPKFVDEKVMDVKAQKLVSSDSSKATLRFVSTLDSTDYIQAGFEITFGSKTVLKTVNNVYSNANVGDGSKTAAEISGAAESQYITLFKLTNIPSAQFDANFTVRAYWQTPDGTAVYSNSAKVVNVNMF